LNLVTFKYYFVSSTLKKVSMATESSIVQADVPGIIPSEGCYIEWQESLILLGKLVEIAIPD
jgi:hypothetical protein